MSDADDLWLRAPKHRATDEMVDAGARRFLRGLVLEHRPRILDLLAERRRKALERSRNPAARPDFLTATRAVREGSWKVAPIPNALRRRVVEITGPTHRRMMLHALRSGADVYMADHEDSTAPTWSNVVEGHRNVRDAACRALTATARDGRALTLDGPIAMLMVRPRGLHLPEAHVVCEGSAVPAALFDFGLTAYHTARAHLERGENPCFYLPKLESHHEARLWRDLFSWTEQELGLGIGSIKATVLIETLPAAFEMDEILYELRDHVLGLNCGRWDYVFSAIKTRRDDPAACFPDRDCLTMDQPFLRDYARLLVRTCHRRGALALGGMAADIPVKEDPVANDAALARVRADKLREAHEGYDGTWVAHPDLVRVAREAFDGVLGGRPNQLDVVRDDVVLGANELLSPPAGPTTEAGLRRDVRVSLEYLAAWLGGVGCVPIDGRMEDAATAEISRARIWQLLRHATRTDDGIRVTRTRLDAIVDEAARHLAVRTAAPIDGKRLDAARSLFEAVALDVTCFEEFATLPAYGALVAQDASPQDPPNNDENEGEPR